MTSVARPDGLTTEQRDRQSLLHPLTLVGDYAAGKGVHRIIASGQGVRVTDATGRSVIDGFSGLYCVNVGYGRDAIVDAMAAQSRTLAFYHVFAGATHEPAVQLGAKLLELAGPRMKRVFFGLSGSDANETQLKLVWYANNILGKPRKKKIIARKRAYHGATIMSGSLTGLDLYHEGFDLPFDLVKHTTAPDPFWDSERDPATFAQRCADDLDRLIVAEGPDTVGAFIAEPLIGTGGIVPPPPGYWQAIQAVLRNHDVLLIVDEVISAFGRVGAMFASPGYGIEPDLITVAKGLTSGYAPLSAVLVGEKVWSALQAGGATHGIFGHGYTYSAHPACAAAALANIAIIEDEDLCGNARDVGAYLRAALVDRLGAHPLVGEVRGDGMLAAVEFVADRATRRPLPKEKKFSQRVAALCLEEGVLARPMPVHDIVGLAPPLILTREDADLIVGMLGRAVDRATAEFGA
jgi:L-2,4-diaminobutyrate transaminase